LDRIAAEVQLSIANMQHSIERAYERQRDELTERLELEQKDRLSAMKRLQWVRVSFSDVTLVKNLTTRRRL